MEIGIIGCGVVGGTLAEWLRRSTQCKILLYDPPKNLLADLSTCEFIFVSVPVPAAGSGQDTSMLDAAVAHAKKFTDKIFIRSTVLPGTNARLGTIAMPEFLTERRAYQDFDELPILVGGLGRPLGLEKVFPNKKIIQVTNIEAEVAKFAHNCFGAFKVTYFNIISELCEKLGADYEEVLNAASLTGFIGKTHTQVPGPDGLCGFGGKCFPENIDALRRFLLDEKLQMPAAQALFDLVSELNFYHRSREVHEPWAEYEVTSGNTAEVPAALSTSTVVEVYT
ncbi:NDP-sugDHase, nucleotide sugar dehydrogenase [uncultured Caudovirales phage]|uniref:NDP-sugDHase, nucleotide sugar dehydrogenase n=1 Tax=uncultured Caudovirales phage TaxID=2100421 RepID=A0A6J5RK46_9CAUD|nr:NDP-sugDHase, nucleotide sugar dehydrogenase [uncultured Caudovirales phage]CAB4197763.1 NDP-sugDHase, nucleotide sugar dehydrogenase [uncultured Caudovirales phage]CAB4210356.1 NDP-sugDHase, nucleotide sugar dehydrogenase [uncultured Caudovirales phage]